MPDGTEVSGLIGVMDTATVMDLESEAEDISEAGPGMVRAMKPRGTSACLQTAEARRPSEEASARAAAPDAEPSLAVHHRGTARLQPRFPAAHPLQEGLSQDKALQCLLHRSSRQESRRHRQEAGRLTEDRQCLRRRQARVLHTQEEAAVQAARAEAPSEASRQRQEARQATTEALRQAAITAARHQPRHVRQVRQVTVQAVAATAEAVPAVAEATAEAAAEARPEEEDRTTIKTDIS